MGIDIETALYQYLAATTTVTGYTSGRIYPSMIPQGVKLPAIVLYKISNPPIHAMSADPELHSPRFQVSVFDDDYDVAKNVAKAVRVALRDYQTSVSGLMGDATSGVDVQRVFFEGEIDLHDLDPETAENKFHIAQDFIIWHST